MDVMSEKIYVKSNSSDAMIVLTATAELTPSTMSPTRSRIGRELETTGRFLLIVIDSTRDKFP